MSGKVKALIAAAVVGAVLLIIAIVTLRGPRASDTRQVDVRSILEKQKPATHPSSLVAKFANGSTVTLFAITDAPGAAVRWWAPDGSPIEPPASIPPNRLTDKQPGDHRTYQFLFAASGLDAASQENLVIASSKSYSETTGRPGRSNDYFNHGASFPTTQQSADFVVMMPQGDWRTAWRHDVPKSGASTNPASTTAPGPATTRPGMIVESIREEGKVTFVQMRKVQQSREQVWESLRAVLAGGNKVGATGMEFKEDGVVQILHFEDAPKAQIVAIECQQQQIDSFELHEVSLKSGHMTRATVSRPTTQP